MLRLQVRANALRWTVLPLIGVALLVLLSGSTRWRGTWPETGAAGQVPALFLSLFAAGAAAWVSGGQRRHRLAEQTAAGAVSRARAEAWQLGVSLLLLLIPYLVGQAVAFTVTARSFPVGVWLWAGYLVMGAFLVALATVWGWLCGKYLSSTFGPLVAVLGWLLLLLSPLGSDDLSAVSGPVEVTPSAGALTARWIALAALTATVLWAPGRPTPWRGARVGLAAPVLGVVVLTAVLLATTGLVARTPPAQALCVPGQVQICLWPEHEVYLPVVRAVGQRAQALPAAFPRPQTMSEYGLTFQTYEFEGGEIVQSEGFDISEGRPRGVAQAAAGEITTLVLDGCNLEKVTASPDPALEALAQWLTLYLADAAEPGQGPPGTELAYQAAREVRSDPLAAQFAWASEQLDAVRADFCG